MITAASPNIDRRDSWRARIAAIRMLLRALVRNVLANIREFFLLERTQARIARWTEPQRQSMRAYHDAATRRMQVARHLQTPELIPVSLSLYRESIFMFALGLMVSRKDDADVAKVDGQAVLDLICAALNGSGFSTRSHLESLQSTLMASEPLASDRLAPEAAIRARDDLDAVTRWLSTLLETRSQRQVRQARLRRLAAVSACGIALLYWILAPHNLAIDKPVRSSVPTYDTAPVGAVDGEKNGRFGFHSTIEDSPWLTIDLRRKHRISSIKVFGRGDCCFDQSVPLALEVSDDGNSFQTIDERKTAFSESDPWLVEPSGLSTRFVRLRTERRSVLVLSEVEVNGYLW